MLLFDTAIQHVNIKTISQYVKQSVFALLLLPSPLILPGGLPFLGVDWHDVDATLGAFSSSISSSSSRSSSS